MASIDEYLTQERCINCLMPCVETKGNSRERITEIFTPFGSITRKITSASDYRVDGYEGIARTPDANGVDIYHYVKISTISDETNSILGRMGVLQDPNTGLFESFSVSTNSFDDMDDCVRLNAMVKNIEAYFSEQLAMYPSLSDDNESTM